MSVFTILRHLDPVVEDVIRGLCAGRYVVRGHFTSPRKFTGQNDLYLHPSEVAIENDSGRIYVQREDGIREIGHLLHLIGLSGTTLRPLAEVTRFETQEDEQRYNRPTPIRIVAADRDKAITCLERASHGTTYRNPQGILAMLASDEPVTYSRSDLVSLLLSTLTVMSADRIRPSLGTPPRDLQGREIARVTGFHDIFASITRTVPVLEDA